MRDLRVKIFLLCCFLSFSGYHDTFAQEDITEYIRTRFIEYCSSLPREEVYVRTDRHEYITGEDMWLSISALDRRSMKPSESRIAYLEILNASNKPVVQKMIGLSGGQGDCRIALPDTLGSGEYLIRCYTNYMKNFLPYNCCLKKFEVYNILRNDKFNKISRIIDNSNNKAYGRYDNPDLTLSVSRVRESLAIYIVAGAKFLDDNNNTIRILIQSRGNISRLTTQILTGTDTVLVPVSSLIPGINQVTVFDTKGPVSDKFFYVPPPVPYHFSLAAPDSVPRRHNIKMMVSTDSTFPAVMGAVMSVALFDQTAQSDLEDYMVAGSEFGPDPFGLESGRKLDQLTAEAIDSTMLALRSNWIMWDSVFTSSPRVTRFLPETEYHYISGRLMDSNLHIAPPGEIVIMSSAGHPAVFEYARTREEGYFSLRTEINEDVKDLIIQADAQSMYRLVLVEPPYSPVRYMFESFTAETATPVLIRKKSIGHQVTRIFGSKYSSLSAIPDGSAQKGNFYGKPDFIMNAGEFIKLDSLQEVFFELVQGVSLTSDKSGYRMTITDPAGQLIEGDPFVMVDGVPIRELGYFAGIDPGLVSKIEVVRERYRIGGYVFNGIVNIITKSSDFSLLHLPAGAIRMHYRVTEGHEDFDSPDYSSPAGQDSRIADYRNTLYWNPGIRLDEKGKAVVEFWSSDVAGEYSIEIEGFTEEGKSISAKRTIKVY